MPVQIAPAATMVPVVRDLQLGLTDGSTRQAFAMTFDGTHMAYLVAGGEAPFWISETEIASSSIRP